MNDEELKNLWQRQALREPALSPAQLISAMQNKTSGLRRTVVARDARELIACVVVAVVFGFYYFLYREPVARLGSLITVAGSFFVAWKLLYVRYSTPQAKADAPVVESLRAELRSVRAQSEMLRSVFWWYLLPLAIGTITFVWGLSSNSLAFKIGFTVMTVILDYFLYRLNQSARTKQLLPVEAQLESMLQSAESGRPISESDAEDLRPMVRSMEAAEHVKPVEFRVAFSQVALYAEIGCVGMWFFMTLSGVIDHGELSRTQVTAQNSTQMISAEEATRYSSAAGKVVEFFNAGDFAALQKLYNAPMSKAFPPKESIAFYARLSALGKVKGFDAPSRNGHQGWIAFPLHFERGEMLMSLALDGSDQIAGIYFEHPPIGPVRIGALAREMFSGRHLLWLAGFFLVGLGVAWLVQKSTDRAVGLSALGVHLLKGEMLILWEEIAEVRTLRILNIRSLWLIRKSGEKMIMPWTSLERREELRAVVEKNAPANHPLREYLRLLR